MNNFSFLIILTAFLTLTALSASAQTTARYSVVPDATGGIWIFDNIQGMVSKCVRPEPAPEEAGQVRTVSPWEFYEDGNGGAPNCSEWSRLSEEEAEE